MAEIKTEPVDVQSESVEPSESKKLEETPSNEAVDGNKPGDLEAKIIRQVEVSSIL